MLGSRYVGGAWLGSGRSHALDKRVPVAATVYAVAGVTGDARRGKMVSASVEAVSSIASDAGRQKSVGTTLAGKARLPQAVATALRLASASLHSSTAVAGLVTRAQSSSATLRYAAGLDGAVNRYAAVSIAIAARVSLISRVRRVRPKSATLKAQASLSGAVGELRPVSATLQCGFALQSKVGIGRTVSALMESCKTTLLGGARSTFYPSASWRTLRVEPKDRALVAQPKDRNIKIVPDDTGVRMYEREKQPSEVVDYTLDMRDWFDEIFEDEIEDVDVTVSSDGDPSALEIGPIVDGTPLPEWAPVGDPVHRAKIWIGGGEDGTDYLVTAIVRTAAKRKEEFDLLLSVINKKK